MKHILLVVIVFSSSLVTSAQADLDVFACEPEWAALAGEIGGDRVKTFSATTPFQDVHFIQARPSLLARVRRADLVVCTGANLEIGWLPVLMRQAANNKVNPGSAGFFEASRYVEMLDVPVNADRASGDVHPYGNPHIQTDPRNILKVASALSDRMQQLDPGNSDAYRQNFESFRSKWNAALERWEESAASLRGAKVVVHHSAWVYMERWLDLEEVAQMEPKPGLPPSASHLATLIDTIRAHDVRFFVFAAYQSPRAARWLSDRTGVPSILLPHTVGATEQAEDLFTWFDDLIRRLKDANRES